MGFILGEVGEDGLESMGRRITLTTETDLHETQEYNVLIKEQDIHLL